MFLEKTETTFVVVSIYDLRTKASKAKIAGHVQFRSMWKFERQMRTMRAYKCNLLFKNLRVQRNPQMTLWNGFNLKSGSSIRMEMKGQQENCYLCQEARQKMLEATKEIDGSEDDGLEDITVDFDMANVVDDSNNDVVISPRSDVPPDIVSASEEEEFTNDDEDEAADEEDEDEFNGELSEEEEDGDADLFGLTEDSESDESE
ncbi:hypothetical protein K7X08_014227 [Anisodus acutangulus]|uniref:Uncharacterized protein n=1 Tax=Anisodus acutangulus TaxID=402998 RepID=A0A9Q1R2X4_9SOLA|nr:hypothetical protein K7X08_014227 [Anisodus acutangulus]